MRRAALVPLLPADHEFVYEMVSHPEVAWRWRYRGEVPSFETVIAHLWDGVAVQRLVVDKREGKMAGLVTLYNHNPRNRTIFLAAVAHPEQHGSGLVAEGAAGILDYAFRRLNARKVYVETLEFNALQFPALIRLAKEEGRFLAHEFQDGKFWDLITMAIYKDDWSRVVSRPLTIREAIAGDLADGVIFGEGHQ